MKQYLLFAYDDYYPLGGFLDFKQSFESYDEVFPYIKNRYKPSSCDWYQIVDSKNGEVEEFESDQIFTGAE